MGAKTDADFSGYVTKAGLKCSDGRTITPDAFKHMDGVTVPLVWQHGHNEPSSILGYTVLEHREDGVYGYGFFNDTDNGQAMKKAVQHGDIKSMSIYANKLVEKAKQVFHGSIREVSLVLAGANPGAVIDQVRIAHSDGEIEDLADEAIIHTGLEIDPAPEAEGEQNVAEHAAGDEDETVEDVFNTLNDKQKEVVYAMLGAAVTDGAADAEAEPAMAQSEESTDSTTGTDSTDSSTQTDTPEGDLTHQEGTTPIMSNVFEAAAGGTQTTAKITHDDLKGIIAHAQKLGSFKEAFHSFVEGKDELKHGIEDIELLFPEAKLVDGNQPQFITRRMEWVSAVLSGTRKSPFARVKTLLADITADEARAKGYIKGTQKVEEVFGLLARTTGPATIYKKQSLDRDDILDITDIDVVLWLKAEMKMMIEEEVARAILVGDGRAPGNPDKVKDPMGSIDGTGIRSILHDDPLYSVKYDLAANVDAKDAVKGLVRARSQFRGSGKPTLFISDAFLTDIMLEEDKFGRPLYETEAVLRDKLRVSNIVTVDLFDGYANLFAIMVSLSDYTIGANRGGELTSFEDFDIDFNKHKYLQETRLSGALTKPFSAVVVRREAGTLVVATAPSFNGTTNEITIPAVEGVYYTVNDDVVTGTFVITGPTEVEARAAEGNYLAMNTTRSWTYTP